jgi:hypothetical protein
MRMMKRSQVTIKRAMGVVNRLRGLVGMARTEQIEIDGD